MEANPQEHLQPQGQLFLRLGRYRRRAVGDVAGLPAVVGLLPVRVPPLLAVHRLLGVPALGRVAIAVLGHVVSLGGLISLLGCAIHALSQSIPRVSLPGGRALRHGLLPGGLPIGGRLGRSSRLGASWVTGAAPSRLSSASCAGPCFPRFYRGGLLHLGCPPHLRGCRAGGRGRLPRAPPHYPRPRRSPELPGPPKQPLPGFPLPLLRGPLPPLPPGRSPPPGMSPPSPGLPYRRQGPPSPAAPSPAPAASPLSGASWAAGAAPSRLSSASCAGASSPASAGAASPTWDVPPISGACRTGGRGRLPRQPPPLPAASPLCFTGSSPHTGAPFSSSVMVYCSFLSDGLLPGSPRGLAVPSFPPPLGLLSPVAAFLSPGPQPFPWPWGRRALQLRAAWGLGR